MMAETITFRETFEYYDRELRDINDIITKKNAEIRFLWFSVFIFPLITALGSVILSVYLSNKFELKMLMNS